MHYMYYGFGCKRFLSPIIPSFYPLFLSLSDLTDQWPYIIKAYIRFSTILKKKSSKFFEPKPSLFNFEKTLEENDE